MCSSRATRRWLPPVVGAVTQLHAWWHILTGLGSYLHILLRYSSDLKYDVISLTWNVPNFILPLMIQPPDSDNLSQVQTKSKGENSFVDFIIYWMSLRALVSMCLQAESNNFFYFCVLHCLLIMYVSLFAVLLRSNSLII